MAVCTTGQINRSHHTAAEGPCRPSRPRTRASPEPWARRRPCTQTAAELGDEESEAERGDGDADGDGGAGGGAAGGARGSRLFLRRSLRGDVADPALRRRLREGGPAALEAADESLAAALQGVVVYNGLETKIACTTYKVNRRERPRCMAAV